MRNGVRRVRGLLRALTDEPRVWRRATFSAGTKGHCDESYAASMRRKPFHIAVAAPEVRTGRMRASW